MGVVAEVVGKRRRALGRRDVTRNGARLVTRTRAEVELARRALDGAVEREVLANRPAGRALRRESELLLGLRRRRRRFSSRISPAKAERTEPGFTSRARSEAPGSFAPKVCRQMMMPRATASGVRYGLLRQVKIKALRNSEFILIQILAAETTSGESTTTITSCKSAWQEPVRCPYGAGSAMESSVRG